MASAVSNLTEERIAYLENLVAQARTAAAVFTQYTQEDVDRILKPMVLAGLQQAQYLARLAVEETKLGVLEDKAIKNMVATEFVYNYVKDKRTVGAIREYPERGLVEVAEPIGVIFSLTPITNPTSTVLFKCIMAIKTRNAVIFSPTRMPGIAVTKQFASCMRPQSRTGLLMASSLALKRTPWTITLT